MQEVIPCDLAWQWKNLSEQFQQGTWSPASLFDLVQPRGWLRLIFVLSSSNHSLHPVFFRSCNALSKNVPQRHVTCCHQTCFCFGVIFSASSSSSVPSSVFSGLHFFMLWTLNLLRDCFFKGILSHCHDQSLWWWSLTVLQLSCEFLLAKMFKFSHS